MFRPYYGVIAAAIVLIAAVLGYFFLPAVPRPPGQQPGETTERTEPGTDNDTAPSPLAVITLATASGEAGGEANRKFAGGMFTLAVRAEGLPALAPGMFYAGWLLPDPAGASAAVYLGPMRLLESGDYPGDYVLGYLADRDLRSHQTVMISREKKDDQRPEESVLSGSFQ